MIPNLDKNYEEESVKKITYDVMSLRGKEKRGTECLPEKSDHHTYEIYQFMLTQMSMQFQVRYQNPADD